MSYVQQLNTFLPLSGTNWDGRNRYLTLTANTALTLTSEQGTGRLYIVDNNFYTLTINGVSLSINDTGDSLVEYVKVEDNFLFIAHLNVVGIYTGGVTTTFPVTTTSTTTSTSTTTIAATPLSYILLSAEGDSQLDWQFIGDAPTTYSIQRSLDNITFTEIDTTALPSYQDLTASDNVPYYYKVVSGAISSNVQKTYKHRGVEFGPNSYYTLPANAKNAITEATQFSFEMWFYATDVGQVAETNRILFYGNNGNAYVTLTVRDPGNGFYFLINDSTNKRIAIATVDYAPSASYYTKSKEVKSRILYHVVCKYAGGGVNGMNMYINGKLVPTTAKTAVSSVTPTSMSVNEFHICGRPTVSAAPYRFYGFRLFKKALSDAEVTELYNGGLPKLTTTISDLATEIMTFSGDNAIDTAANPLTPILTGTVTQRYLTESISQQYITPALLSGVQELDLKDMGGGPIYNSLTAQALSPIAAFQQAGPIVLEKNGKLYYSLNFGGGPGRGYEPFILQLDKGIETLYRTNLGIVNNCDGHEVTTIINGYDGSVILAKETNKHNDTITFYKTTDFRTFTSTITTAATNLAYPTLVRLTSSRIGVMVRFGTREIYRLYSDDHFSTLSPMTMILQLDTPSPVDDNRPYYMLANNPDGTADFLVFCTRNNNTEFYMAFLLRTTDMITFSNLSGTFSKNITSGQITETELKANFTIFDETATAGFTRRNSGVCRKDTGEYYIITGDASQNLYLYYNSGTSWLNKTLSIVTALSATNSPEITAPVHISGDTFWIFIIRDIAGQRIPYKYITTDNFTTLDAGTAIWSGVGDCSQLHLTKTAGKITLLFSIYKDTIREADLGLYTEVI